MATNVFSFEVTVAGTNWRRTVNAHTAGKAKYDYWQDVTESWPDIPFTAIRARKLGKPQNTEGFSHAATYRGMPKIQCGQRVAVGKGVGVIVGSNSSANFNVLFDLDSPKYPGQKLNVHPAEIQLEEKPHGN